MRVGTAGRIGYTLAYIWRVAGGDTVYGVSEPSSDMRRSPKERAMYRKDCKRFTPRELKGPLPKSMATAEVAQHNTSLYFDLSAPSSQTFSALPEWLRKKIDSRLQAHSPSVDETDSTQSDEPFDDSIPF